MDDMIGRTLAHYRIASALGAGGMGEVYRAIDTKLGRAVALKVLPAAMARDPERLARFEREARAVAALNHPHIVTLHSVEEDGGITFLTMELVEGDSLADRIPHGGLPLDQILSIGAALSDALAAAHDKGIVHRDLKPANVMLTADGRVKVLDFGLAKDLRPADQSDMSVTMAGRTEVGMVMGTPAYMSPEQLAGRPVDHRTDIFSLGILLYQMSSGQRPFEGASSIELASAILRDTPPPLGNVRPEMPAALTRLIQRCLEKDRERRVQAARDVAGELQDIARRPSPETPRGSDSGSRRTDEGFRVAVLPFKYGGSSAEVAGLADGLSEEIVTGLSRFSYLRVIARSSTSRYAGAAADVRTIAREIGARYVMEGSVRQSGTQLRIAVQMVDATDGAHLWAETYNRPFQADAIFDLQDELVPRIVSTVADSHGVLPRTMGDALRSRAASELTPYEALLRGCSFYARIGPAEHAEVRAALERAAEQAPDHADVWAFLSMLYQDEHRHGFNPRPNPLDRALAAARRAVDLGPSNHFAYHGLASTQFFRRDLPAFRQAAERTITLNPMDGNALANMGCLIAYAGDWTQGLELVERAQRLNPHHPGWFWLPNFYNSYRVGDYAAALQAAAKVNMPAYFWAYVVTIAAQGQLGGRPAAADALQQLLRIKPDIARTVRNDLQKWFVEEELVEHLIDGLRKAGLDAPTTSRDTVTAPAVDKGSGSASTARSIAVLPFANMSADKDEDYFSDGLAEEIINLLAQASGLKVIARSSAFAFRGKDEDVRKIGQALDVTHLLEGSVRRAGGRIRVTAQLISAADGGHVWSERYDREMRDVFALQDDIAEAIAKALRVRLSGDAPPRHVPSLPAYEAYLRARHHQAKVTPEAWDLAKACFESAIELDPAFALAHVGLGYYWLGQVHFGRSPAHEAIPAARAAARRALGVDASLPEAHALLGTLAAQYDLDFEAAERFFDAPMARQAGYPLTRPIYGGFLFLKGEGARAIALAERTIAEDPLEVWPRMNLHAYLQAAGRDQEAYEQTVKALELDPNLVVARVSVAHFQADWGKLPEAVAAARKAVEIGPWYQDARATLAALLHVCGAEDEALQLQRSLGTGETPGDCRAQALYHLLRGDVDTAADWVEKAIAERDGSMLYYLQFVVCRPLRASARWPKIARLVNLPDVGPV